MYVRGQRERRTNLREECAKGKERDRERHYTRANNQAEIKPATTITSNLCRLVHKIQNGIHPGV